MQNFSDASEKINIITDSISEVGFVDMINNLEQTIQNFNSITAKIENGKGNLGKLMQDDALYTNLENSSKQLEELLKDMKLNPKRYVHFSVFGKKNKEYQSPEEEK